MEETRLTKLTLTNPSQVTSTEPMQQNQNTQSKKLYFKQSATEALHSAILLKARNPLGSDLQQQQQQQQQQQTSIINNTKLFKSNAEANKILCPKLANANTLLTISSTANSSQILNNINNLDTSNNSNLIDSNQPNSENNNNNNNNHMSFDELAELDSPLKIKENILASIRNLKPALIGLDPLRSSTSDDEDSHSDNIERKFKNLTKTNQNESTAMDSSPAESEVIILSQNQSLKSNIQLKPQQQQQQQTQFALLKQPQQRHIYLRANSTNTAGTKTLTKLPNFASNLSIATSQLNASSTVISTPVLINKTGQLSKIQLSRATSKRGKEEALSNSSSSDEEEQKETCILPTNLKIVNSTSQPSFVSNNSSFKLQQLILNPNKVQAATTSTPIQLKQLDSNKNALLALNQPHITPVVNSAAAAAALAAAQSSNANIAPVVSQSILSTSSSSSSSASSSPSSAHLNSSESELAVSSPSSSPSSLSFKSQKSSIDHEYTNSSLSAASPTSCCSSSATNDVGIDLHDDNSSTASEPTYARQPGFEHHAHEVVVMQKLPHATPKSLANVNMNKTMLNKLKKGETCSSLLSKQQQQLQKNEPKSTNKAKKKLCMMNSDVANLNVGINGGETVSGSELADRQNVQLKPISNRAKREPLPMRLRALPMSFWQQPNQPNVSPGVMYLPPLFKNEIESVESNDELISEENKLIGEQAMQTSGSSATTTANNREIRISNANTDLLFKLFENIEQKDKKSLQLQLQSQLKMHRLSTQKPVKTLSKALIKGEDPCIVDAVSEGLFPLLRLDSRSETVHYLAFKTSESTLNSLTSNGLSNSSPLISSNPSLLSSAVNNLPMLQLEQNYAQELSDVVAAL